MGDVLFIWTAAYQTCVMRACVPRLLSGFYQLFDLFLISRFPTLACLVTKQCLMVFGRQTFPVCPGPNSGFTSVCSEEIEINTRVSSSASMMLFWESAAYVPPTLSLTNEAENSSSTLPNVVIATPHYKEMRIVFAQFHVT